MRYLFFALLLVPCLAFADAIDLTSAVVVAPAGLNEPEQKAVQMLVEEVHKRAFVRWEVVNEWPADGRAVIAVGPESKLAEFAGQFTSDAGTAKGPEGYRIKSVGACSILVVGNDSRGVLFGVGGLLRQLRLGRFTVHAPSDLDINTAPKYPLRGHQLGYRPKVNTYDGWTPAMYEQYIRDLAVFGANAIELMPPKTDDDAESPHFTISQIDMMAEVSRIADSYGIDIWIWYPAMAEDNSDPATVERELAEWHAVFARLPRIDAIFVPGGDPGHTQPKHLLALLEKQTENLHKTHPKAQMWMSPQGFNLDWMNEFIELMKQEPAWLTGIVYGPQNRISLPELRTAISEKYPIRHYPDITHDIRCQLAVPDWDVAYVMTEEREAINPRPVDMARICRQYDDYTIGFLTYSEGCNDDVNKAVWSALGWDPEADVAGVLREFSRYFIGPDYEEGFTQALFALERNWQAPLLTNFAVTTTLQQVQAMEAAATPQVKLNWRFQQVLYRAYYDAFVRARLIYETVLEEQAMQALRQAPRTGSAIALAKAQAALDKAILEPAAEDLRARVFELGEALFQSIRMQLSKPRYAAIDPGRGANLDLIDRPLNDKAWLEAEFAQIRALQSEPERLSRIDAIVNWTNPGPGGFYDDLGNLTQQPHLVRPEQPNLDPEYRDNPRMGFDFEPGQRMSWVRFAETIYDTPLRLQYNDLDKNTQYKVRVVYNGEDTAMRMDADGMEVHALLPKFPIRPQEFDVPAQATADGSLTLSFQQRPGARGSGRGCQVSEVWLMRK